MRGATGGSWSPSPDTPFRLTAGYVHEVLRSLSVCSALLIAVCVLILHASPARSSVREWVFVDRGAALLPSPVATAAEAVAPSDATAGEVLARTTVGTVEFTRLRWHGSAVWARSDRVWPAAAPLDRRTLERFAALSAGSSAEDGGMLFVDAETGQVLFSRHPDRPRILASVTKVFTVAAAAAGRRLTPGLAARILKPSHNGLADRLAARLGGGSVRRGAQRAAAWAADAGVRAELADGSGLSRRNRASPFAVVSLLQHLEEDPAGSVLRAFPTAGRSGTLAGRLRGTAAEGACQAKTGTLYDVSALAGRCTTLAGRTVFFAMLMNRCDVYRARRLQDRILRTLVAWDRRAGAPLTLP